MTQRSTVALASRVGALVWGLALALSGALGCRDSADLPSASQVIGRAGHYNTCAVLQDRHVRCWGLGANGLVGFGTANLGGSNLPSTGAPLDLGGDVGAVSLGMLHACATMADGEVQCWGDGSWGAVGYGNEDTVGDDEAPASVGSVPLY